MYISLLQICIKGKICSKALLPQTALGGRWLKVIVVDYELHLFLHRLAHSHLVSIQPFPPPPQRPCPNMKRKPAPVHWTFIFLYFNFSSFHIYTLFNSFTFAVNWYVCFPSAVKLICRKQFLYFKFMFIICFWPMNYFT